MVVVVEYCLVALLLAVGLALLLTFLASGSLMITVGILVVVALTILAIHYWQTLGRGLDQLFLKRKRWAYAIGLLLALAIPFLIGGNTYVYHLFIISMLMSIVAVALNFQLGSANLPNFASGASYGIGAYTAAILMVQYDINFWPAMVAAALVASAFGVLLGIPCMKTRDYYLALVTIAFAVVVHAFLNNMQFTGGPGGIYAIPTPSIFGHSFREHLVIFGFDLPSAANFYYLSLAALVFSIVLGHRIHNSRIGLAWNAIGADPLAASCQGINVVGLKVLAFAVDAFLAAIAGTIYASYTSYISPVDFTFLVSVTIMTMVIVGGMDNVLGVIIGAFVLTVLPEKFRIFADYRLLLFGVAVVAMMMLRPQGILPRQVRRY